MPAIEKYYKIEEVFAWQWDGNANINAEDFPAELRNDVTGLKVERRLKTSFNVELKNKHLANCQKCGRMGAECFTTTIEEYDIYEKILCEDCLAEMIDKKMSAIEHKKIE